MAFGGAVDFYFILVLLVFPAISIGKPLLGKWWLFPSLVAAIETWVHERQTLLFNTEGSQRSWEGKSHQGWIRMLVLWLGASWAAWSKIKSCLEIQESGTKKSLGGFKSCSLEILWIIILSWLLKSKGSGTSVGPTSGTQPSEIAVFIAD